jgi:dethiobiotin synthetase
MLLKQANSFFVTGTDTGCGKTTVTRLLIQTLQQSGFQAIGCKPIACGVDQQGDNEDVLVYERINSLSLPRIEINPICLTLPASPHIAAQQENRVIDVLALSQELNKLKALPVDFIFFEGVGGWKVPLNQRETTIDLALSLQAPLILVIGIRVGCLNHALLTWEAIQKVNVAVTGWIANVVDPTTPAIDDHIATLQQWIDKPCLTIIPFGDNSDNTNDIYAIRINSLIS